jgi:excinuclease UvrABC nuclease subunit
MARSVRTAARIAPNAPGVYAIGRVRRDHGLVVKTTWMYVGRSTTSLSRRLRGHRTTDEQNLALRAWLASNPGDLEVWFTSVESAKQAVALERALIRQLDPPFNVMLRPRPAIEVVA